MFKIGNKYANTNKLPKKKNESIINEKIRARMLTVIDETGQNCGMLDRDTAIYMAEERGLDLVLVSPNAKVPVAKIMDYGKFKYEKQRKERAARQNQQVVILKEIRLSPVIDIGDFNTKLKQGRKFISKGNKLKVTVKFKGRQLAHKNLGLEVINRYWDSISDIADREYEPKHEGKNIHITLVKKKEE